MTSQGRQGDVLLERSQYSVVPQEAKEVPPNEYGMLVLASGGNGGNIHAVPARDARLYSYKTDFILEVLEPTDLKHPEHGKIPLEPGLYDGIRQREDVLGVLRTVVD